MRDTAVEIHTLLDLSHKELSEENQEKILLLIKNLTPEAYRNVRSHYAARYNRFLSRDLSDRLHPERIEKSRQLFITLQAPLKQ